MLVVAVGVRACKAEFAFDLRVNVEALLPVLALGEEGALIRRVKVGALIWGQATPRVVLALGLLLITALYILVLNDHPSLGLDSDVVLVLRQVDHSLHVGIQPHLLVGPQLSLLKLLLLTLRGLLGSRRCLRMLLNSVLLNLWVLLQTLENVTSLL